MWRRKGEGDWKRGMADEAVPLCGLIRSLWSRGGDK